MREEMAKKKMRACWTSKDSTWNTWSVAMREKKKVRRVRRMGRTKRSAQPQPWLAPPASPASTTMQEVAPGRENPERTRMAKRRIR